MKRTGTVEALNMSPKGFHQGFLLKTDKGTIQVNVSKHEIGALGKEVAPGEVVSLDVKAEESQGSPAHRVFQLIRLHGVKGESGHAGPEDHRFAGKVKSLNYALHGEVNGGILDSGDFLHLKPRGASAVDLKVGMAVKGRGHSRPMTGGRFVIDAVEVNGVAMDHHKAAKKHPGKKHAAAKHAKD